MKVEILYFDGCPNHGPTVERVKEALQQEGLTADIAETNVGDDTTALEVGFLGSPSVRVDGLDVEPEVRSVQEYGMMCRTYLVDGRREGLPSVKTIRRAILAARSPASAVEGCCQPAAASFVAEGKPGSTSLFMAGSVTAAIAASLCCTLPIVFALRSEERRVGKECRL